MFETLLSKTLFLLATSLAVCCLGTVGIIKYFRLAYAKGATYVTAKCDKDGKCDLEVNRKLLVKIFWPAFIINIIAFIFLLIFKENFPLNIFIMYLFTFTDGITLGLVLLEIDENIGIKVTLITTITTLIASLIAMYSGLDFSFLEKFLFYALTGLLIISVFRIFHTIDGFHRKIIACSGILIFIAYLLLDFNHLAKAKDVPQLNDWNIALDFAISIYLDIINLFMQILDLLSN